MKWISAVDTDDSKLQYKEFFKSLSSKYNNCIDKFFGLHDTKSLMNYGTLVNLYLLFHMDRLQ